MKKHPDDATAALQYGHITAKQLIDFYAPVYTADDEEKKAQQAGTIYNFHTFLKKVEHKWTWFLHFFYIPLVLVYSSCSDIRDLISIKFSKILGKTAFIRQYEHQKCKIDFELYRNSYFMLPFNICIMDI